jgi:hypothetical protein
MLGPTPDRLPAHDNWIAFNWTTVMGRTYPFRSFMQDKVTRIDKTPVNVNVGQASSCVILSKIREGGSP